ncbi:MAG TPA: succinate dehydrogenase, hydrophobic membrane anchor protein [Sphingomonadales bacterium]
MSAKSKNLRTPLALVRGLGSAKDGSHHWWVQRVTAVALIPLTLWFVASIAAMTGADYETVRAWIANPVVAVLLLLTIVATFYHLKLGIQVVLEDYVHHMGLRVASQLAVTFACFAVGAAAAFAVLKIAFQG